MGMKAAALSPSKPARAENGKLITVEYSLTKEGLTLKPILDLMREWATGYKKQMVKGVMEIST